MFAVEPLATRAIRPATGKEAAPKGMVGLRFGVSGVIPRLGVNGCFKGLIGRIHTFTLYALDNNCNNYFMLCILFSSRYLAAMEWKDQLAGLSAADLVAALGCPKITAYHWLDGKRKPPTWQQPHWLAILRRHGENPASQQTRRKRGVK